MRRYMKSSLPAVTLTVFLTGIVYARCPVGDLNGDCRVDLADVAVFAEQWLAPPESPADLNGDDRVNIVDLALLVEQWGQTGVPLVISEFMASNNNYGRDPQGQYDDWIEIHNHGPEPVDTAPPLDGATEQRSRTATLAISGMTCSHCAANVRRALLACPGVASATVDLAGGRATVAGTGLDLQTLQQAAESLGYGVRPGAAVVGVTTTNPESTS